MASEVSSTDNDNNNGSGTDTPVDSRVQDPQDEVIDAGQNKQDNPDTNIEQPSSESQTETQTASSDMNQGEKSKTETGDNNIPAMKEANKTLPKPKENPDNPTESPDTKQIPIDTITKTSGTPDTSKQQPQQNQVILEQDKDLQLLHSACNDLIEESKNRIDPSGDAVLRSLVTEDLSSIKSEKVLHSFFVNYLHRLPSKCVSEVLSVLIAIVKKSVFHLESTRGLILPCINHLLSDTFRSTTTCNSTQHIHASNSSNNSLTRHFLREWINLMITHSCNVEELSAILRLSEEYPSLLYFVQQSNLRQRNRPHAFFAFPGTKGSMMSLPPFQKWPIQFGWSFSTWFFLEPKACAQPYLYNFKTSKSGLGYSAHFTGNCLVITSIRVKGKGVQHCIAYEFPSYKWTHCAITYHNKWRASEIKVYIDGQLSANIEMPWQVQTTELFDKCYIGSSGSLAGADRSSDLHAFSGRMSAIYLFSEGLSPTQICALHRLGPSYMGQFKYSNENHANLPPHTRRILYEEKLSSTLFCLLTPVAVDSGTLCIQMAPFRSSTSIPAQNHFFSSPHAALSGQTKAIIAQPISFTLQSLGCTRYVFPLLEIWARWGDSEACALAIKFLCDLLEGSPHWFANEMVQNNGFVVIACALSVNSRILLTDKLLDIFLNLTRTLLTTITLSGDSLLLKHMMDNLLFNPSLWIYAEAKVQIKLYNYLANEFLHGTRHSSNKYTLSSSSQQSSSPNSQSTSGANTVQSKNSDDSQMYVTDHLFGEIRRVSTVLQSLHALKHYYWVVEEPGIHHKARNQRLRPAPEDLVTIRANILAFTKELISRANSAPVDEVQGFLNYLSSCTQPENLIDLMDCLSTLIEEHPTPMILAMDQKQAVKVLFVLIGSRNEEVRVKAIRLLSRFLARCSHKKKQDIMGPNNLFMLLCDRLRAFRPMTIDLYNALIDLMLENEKDLGADHSFKGISKRKIENSIVIKVIANLLHEERTSRRSKSKLASPDYPDIRKLFINHLWNLIVNNRENRRIILQMSVWQHWLINLIDSTLHDDPLVKDQILAIFRVLLYHAIRYEYGGWRVWIDTLAIIHAKISFDEFCQQISIENQSEADAHQIRSTSEIPQDLKKVAVDRKDVQSEVKPKDIVDEASISKSGKEDSHSAPVPTDVVGSISQQISHENQAIQLPGVQGKETKQDEESAAADVDTNTGKDEEVNESLNQLAKENQSPDEGVDSVDIAPTRAFRKISLDATTEDSGTGELESTVTRQQSMISIALEEPSTSDKSSEPTTTKIAKETTPDTGVTREDTYSSKGESSASHCDHKQQKVSKATASPAFRIPEFKWSGVLIKLLNDLMFSIECDLYHWRCLTQSNNLDTPPFTPKVANTSNSNQTSNSGSNASKSANASSNQLDSLLQKAEHQIYLINIIHLVSQLADHVIIASGGLLPLLAEATGGSRNVSSTQSTRSESPKQPVICEGLSIAQSNTLLYRLINMVDIVVFAAHHISLVELEADKNTTSGGILRQCLRLACTVTVKNCLVLREIQSKVNDLGIGGELTLASIEFPKDLFDSYQGCSLLSANGLFEDSALLLDNTDLIANIEYSPHQTPNTTSMPSLLPFQTTPIRDPNKLVQWIDICRIQACIYHNQSTDSRQSQFLALSSLYFISVLMVSKYHDIIEPKNKTRKSSSNASNSPRSSMRSDTSPVAGEASSNNIAPVSSAQANILTIGKMQPHSSFTSSGSSSNTLTNMLTRKLEMTLDTVCPLLRSIMCDFSSFLSETLLGTHGQDLVSKETERTFKRANTSPVELVMLLCSQEWQNTLQKNAGLAFIELINEGRILSHGMKDHIVRVAMEAEFILSRLRADDVAKHEQFGLDCSESISSRLHEEALINSLISSASRRDHVLFHKFKESVLNEARRNYKLDIWEDDDRRKRRFILDSWDDAYQNIYNAIRGETGSRGSGKPAGEGDSDDKSDTKRILELQQTIELGGISDHCVASHNDHSSAMRDEDCDEEEYDDEDDDEEDEERHNPDSNSPDSEPESRNQSGNNVGSKCPTDALQVEGGKMKNVYPSSSGTKTNENYDANDNEDESKFGLSVWEYDDNESTNEFAGSVIFATECCMIWGIYAIPGVFQLTSQELHFEPNQNIVEAIDALKKEQPGSDREGDNSLLSLRSTHNDSLSSEHISLRKIDLKALRYCDFLTCNGKVSLHDIRAIFSRHYLLQPNALEIFLTHRTSVMFAFNDFDTVKKAVKYLPPVGVGIKYGIAQNRRASLMSPRQLFAASNMTKKWQKREISNFQYLMFLNTIAGRTYQDLNQYPVFPWILTNYDSEELDLNLPTNFRDLSKPVGALNNKRREEFIERYQNWDNPKVPAFHYGTHYSTAAFTLNWLCRLRGQSNSCYLALQDGKYEEETRLFLSIGDSWVSSLIGGQQNVKELVPEFFYLPEMFHSNLGLPEVEYPPWAKSAEQFVRIHRIALESELVSCQLHQWIDLIFGYKQRGPEAVNAVNTFYYLTYQGSVNLSLIQDASLRDAIATQIKHFGQTPSQLTTEPHPPRFSALHVSPLMFSPSADELSKVIKFPFNNPIVLISSCINNFITPGGSSSDGSSKMSSSSSQITTGSSGPSSIVTITANNQYQIHRWVHNEQSDYEFIIDPQLETSGNVPRRQLIDVDDQCSSISLQLSPLTAANKSSMNEVQWPRSHYIVTLNGRFIIMGSFYDNSFRVFSTESGKLCQVVYGHRGPITCMARSEGNATADFYIATGSSDCSLMIWTWNDRYAQVEGSGVSAVHNPLPKLSLHGHQTPVLSAMICSELGLVVSGSKNLILAHTLTTTENLLKINVTMPDILDRTLRDNCIMTNRAIQNRPQVKDKEGTLLEASMLGDGFRSRKLSKSAAEKNPQSLSKNSNTAYERFEYLRDMCRSDYFITNIQLARELGFIVCVALPTPKNKPTRQTGDQVETNNSAALLLTFNLKGCLMDSTPIGHAANGPRLGDVCVVHTSRDGEILILNDSPTTLKIYRTFGLQPIYAFNTNDIPNALSEDQNRIKSLALIEERYILVGLENGRIIIYESDLKKLN